MGRNGAVGRKEGRDSHHAATNGSQRGRMAVVRAAVRVWAVIMGSGKTNGAGLGVLGKMNGNVFHDRLCLGDSLCVCIATIVDNGPFFGQLSRNHRESITSTRHGLLCIARVAL